MIYNIDIVCFKLTITNLIRNIYSIKTLTINFFLNCISKNIVGNVQYRCSYFIA
jgi:hypothetical protein